MNRESFEKIVAQALDDLPPYFQEKINNLEILIEPRPSRYELERAELKPGYALLGLYSGIPLTDRTHHYGMVPPDTITLFQRPIEQAAETPEGIPALVRNTVIHEIAHHFGIGDDRLRELGAY